MEKTNTFDSKYRYILVAARRARQLESGAPALVESRSRKACRVAQDEMDAGKVSYIVNKNEGGKPSGS
jgi:DNA-directed RNA polymerase subunit omega